jgi:hypothetical protein
MSQERRSGSHWKILAGDQEEEPVEKESGWETLGGGWERVCGQGGIMECGPLTFSWRESEGSSF